MFHSSNISIVEQLFGVVQHSVNHVHSVSVALVGQVDQTHLQSNNVLWWQIWSGPNHSGDLVTEDVEQLNVAGYTRYQDCHPWWQMLPVCQSEQL